MGAITLGLFKTLHRLMAAPVENLSKSIDIKAPFGQICAKDRNVCLNCSSSPSVLCNMCKSGPVMHRGLFKTFIPNIPKHFNILGIKQAIPARNCERLGIFNPKARHIRRAMHNLNRLY